MPGGGTIFISAENAAGIHAHEPSGDFVRLRIRDTGQGMSAEVRARAFEPFFTTKETGKGSGLGLAQVYGFTTQSGGDVRIESAVGRGTTVDLLLPRTHAGPTVPVEPDARAATTPAQGTLTGRVLFVEDDPEVASVTSETLRGLGLDVLHVSDAASALAWLAEDRPVDLLFSDMMMPGGISGVELAREVRHRRPSLPIVLASGLEASAADAREHDIELLLKPYDAGKLAATMAAHLAATPRAGAVGPPAAG